MTTSTITTAGETTTEFFTTETTAVPSTTKKTTPKTTTTTPTTTTPTTTTTTPPTTTTTTTTTSYTVMKYAELGDERIAICKRADPLQQGFEKMRILEMVFLLDYSNSVKDEAVGKLNQWLREFVGAFDTTR